MLIVDLQVIVVAPGTDISRFIENYGFVVVAARQGDFKAPFHPAESLLISVPILDELEDVGLSSQGEEQQTPGPHLVNLSEALRREEGVEETYSSAGNCKRD